GGGRGAAPFQREDSRAPPCPSGRGEACPEWAGAGGFEKSAPTPTRPTTATPTAAPATRPMATSCRNRPPPPADGVAAAGRPEPREPGKPCSESEPLSREIMCSESMGCCC